MADLISIFAPMTGSVTELEFIPDPDYAAKTHGDGVAIVPEDNALYCPVNGVFDGFDAKTGSFAFRADDNLDVLVQVGIGEYNTEDIPFTLKAQVGSSVQAGDHIADVDLEKVMSFDVLPMVPVIITSGMDGLTVKPGSGHVEAGAGAVMTIEDKRDPVEEEPEEATPEEPAEEIPAEEPKTSAPNPYIVRLKAFLKAQLKENIDFLKQPGMAGKVGAVLILFIAFQVLIVLLLFVITIM